MSLNNQYKYLYGTQLQPYDFNNKDLCVNNYVRYMLARTQQMFKYSNLPETISQRSMELIIQCNGYACIAEYNGNLYAFYGGLGGVPDVYYMPTICVVSNPALNLSKEFKIDIDCVIIPNDSMYMGLLPLNSKYATAMVENDISFKMANINTRIAQILSAPDDNTAESAQKYIKDIESGKLGIIGENSFLDGIKVHSTGSTSNGFLTQLIEYHQYLKAGWYNELGLQSNYNMKREAINSNESQLNEDSLMPLIDDMLEKRKEAMEKINAMFGTNISVELSSSWKKEDNYDNNNIEQPEDETLEQIEEVEEDETN